MAIWSSFGHAKVLWGDRIEGGFVEPKPFMVPLRMRQEQQDDSDRQPFTKVLVMQSGKRNSPADSINRSKRACNDPSAKLLAEQPFSRKRFFGVSSMKLKLRFALAALIACDVGSASVIYGLHFLKSKQRASRRNCPSTRTSRCDPDSRNHRESRSV